MVILPPLPFNEHASSYDMPVMPQAPQSFAGTSRWCYCFALNLTPTTTSLAETTICAIKSTREVLNTVKCIDCHAAGIFTWFNVTICHIIKHDLSNKSC